MALVFAAAASSVLIGGCSPKKPAGPLRVDSGPQAEQREEGEQAEPDRESDDGGRRPSSGVEDFVDYATGKLPIEKGRQIEKRFRDIQAEHNRRLEDAMGE